MWHSCHIAFRLKHSATYLYYILLGQEASLHTSVSVVLPTQSRPPFWGTGFVHVRDLDLVPLPHVTEHVVQFVHAVKPPSTEAKFYNGVVKMHWCIETGAWQMILSKNTGQTCFFNKNNYQFNSLLLCNIL